MWRTVFLVTVSVAAWAQPPSLRIGIIDFYGQGSLDTAPLRAALPFHEGDLFPPEEVEDAARETLRKLSGRAQVEISEVCCLPDGRATAFVGLAEPGAPEIPIHAAPKGEMKLPAEILKIFARRDKDLFAAIQRGNASEDRSQGYSLSADPETRHDQLAIRDWARAHTSIVLRVLTGSRDTNQRQYAAEALGYAERSPQQIAALVQAAFDASENVRNAATRALGVLCSADPAVARQIPLAKFVPMLRSVTWTDRNKGTMLFFLATVGRDSAAFSALREGGAGPALREMAQWKDWGHAQMAAVILGRMAAVPEERLQNLDSAEKIQGLLAIVGKD